MLSYIDVTFESDPLEGGIKISSMANVDDLNGINGLVISRRKSGDTTYTKIKTIELSSVDDLKFNLLDYTVMSNSEYTYSIDIKSGDIIKETEVFGPISFQFEGMFIGDNDGHYLAALDCEVTTKRNRPVAFVTTLSSRTPFCVSNEIINYDSGEAVGLFLKYSSEEKRFIPDDDHSYAREVVDFLTNGSGKVLKMGDGRAWYISVDETVTEMFDDRYKGRNQIEFGFVEIGDIPKFDMLAEVK